MTNKFDEMAEAIDDARTLLRAADANVRKMADMVAGRLRVGNVSNSTLTALKKELRDYNIHTGTWVEK